jgi:hypothetical protein
MEGCHRFHEMSFLVASEEACHRSRGVGLPVVAAAVVVVVAVVALVALVAVVGVVALVVVVASGEKVEVSVVVTTRSAGLPNHNTRRPGPLPHSLRASSVRSRGKEAEEEEEDQEEVEEDTTVDLLLH